jgi:radical SAM protein (TIGR01212 family)
MTPEHTFTDQFLKTNDLSNNPAINIHQKVPKYPWGHERRYNDYPTFIRQRFGGRVQKLSINAGFTCPNRDGSKGTKGCSYCNNNTFRPGYCEPEKSVTQQIDEGVQVFYKKHPDSKFMAYFQSYSNTYAEIDLLDRVYDEALMHPKVHGLVIGTRPDCINAQVLDLTEQKAKSTFVAIEYGIESTLDTTLERINRQHNYAETIRAVKLTKNRNIHIGGHLILGLPGESNADMLSHASRISKLGLDTLKLHQLQIVRNTPFAKEYKNRPDDFSLFELPEYIGFVVGFLELLDPGISIERFVNQSPGSMLIAPKWGMKNFEIVSKIEKKLQERNTWQGRKHSLTVHN